jgi:hypothetical protein
LICTKRLTLLRVGAERKLLLRCKQLLELERRRIVEALRQSGGKIYGADGAAERLGMRPTTLTSKIGGTENQAMLNFVRAAAVDGYCRFRRRHSKHEIS